MAVQRKHKIRAIRRISLGFNLAELRKRYKEAHEYPITAEQLRNMPDLLDPDFGKSKPK